MTREEAAKILEKLFDESCGDYRYQNKDKLDYEDALWLAITALRELDEQDNPKPLTLDELRQMDDPVWCLYKPIEGGAGFWCLCDNGYISAPSGFCFGVSEIPDCVFLRHKPKKK